MELKIFDVEHGACTLLTTDLGHRLMVDCGHNATTGWYPGAHLAGNVLDASMGCAFLTTTKTMSRASLTLQARCRSGRSFGTGAVGRLECIVAVSTMKRGLRKWVPTRGQRIQVRIFGAPGPVGVHFEVEDGYNAVAVTLHPGEPLAVVEPLAERFPMDFEPLA